MGATKKDRRESPTLYFFFCSSGEITLDDFIAFVQRKTWGLKAEADRFEKFQAATGKLEGTAANDDPLVDRGGDAGDSDSDNNDSRYGFGEGWTATNPIQVGQTIELEPAGGT